MSSASELSHFYALEALYEGKWVSFEKFRNQGLVQLDQKYRNKGLAVIAFPCNQFGHQEPFSNEEIRKFAFEKYNATFPIFDKVDVNGPNASPVYQFLKKSSHTGDIEWNYVKFLINLQGKVSRFAPFTDPLELEKTIRTYLSL
ncbi:Phospholipid hydroperoxide glutathione peroxidase, chloroplastic [Galdieria sulphuraria]|nr:Phospholipid hydroperoxide glutathione peroxidase, chloroplastic [Galdieria sulphuraria]